ncbi:MAG: PBP1A family penicillin-binding protein [Calditrichaeota bacterium]|nr:MAG: PBP1A family penicillin-binding protein [Calditrichota bacterium]MBL1205125.1 PBP1A family penicillin-binding protein [Calditrichota bacterium]NOG44955.1 PBP1A family penicillin-binding protein [Calditrichota bacterium]
MKRKKRGHPTSTTIRPVTSKSTKSAQFNQKPAREFKKSTWILSSVAFLFVLFIIIFFFSIKDDLQSFEELERIDPAIATQVYSSDGELLHSFFTSNRAYTPYERIPKNVIDALLSTEDRGFYKHWGIDSKGIARAFVNLFRYGGIHGGGSTVTMQLSRNLYFGYEQTPTRKIKEMITSIQLEKTYSKNEILEMYLNICDFGNHAVGIQSAAKRYFDKELDQLNNSEAALLIGILKGPSWYSPIRHPERAKKRRNIVLSMMLDNNKISRAQFDSLKQKDLNLELNDPNKIQSAPYFVEYIRRQLNRLQDSLDVNIYEDGLKVYTSLNTQFQEYMEKSITKNIDTIQERVRNQRDFAELKETLSDTAFNEQTEVQLAFVALNPHNGQILAMVGGRDFEKSKFNRVTQAKRQPGSSFKPFLYTAAIDNGYSPASQFHNQPTVEINADGTRWTPENYDKSRGGLTPLTTAIRKSLNLVAVRLINEVHPRIVKQYANAMGISTQIRPFSSLALGTSEVIPLELVSAYGIFANNGLHVKPISIVKIEDKNGSVIYQNIPEPKEVLSPETTHIVRDMMEGIVNHGTGGPIRWKHKFYGSAAGKTGTTNSFTDAWFVGYTPDIAAGVWVGMDDQKQTLGPGMAGGVVALPFWADFMKSVYDSVSFNRGTFVNSPGVFEHEVCLETQKSATAYCPNTMSALFTSKNKPNEACDVHTGFDTSRKKRRRF